MAAIRTHLKEVGLAWDEAIITVVFRRGLVCGFGRRKRTQDDILCL